MRPFKNVLRSAAIVLCFAWMAAAMISCSGGSSPAGNTAAPPPGPQSGRLEMDLDLASLRIQAAQSSSVAQEVLVDVLDPATRRLVVATTIIPLTGDEQSVHVLIDDIPPGRWLASVLLRSVGATPSATSSPTATPTSTASPFNGGGIPTDPNRIEQLVDIFATQVTVVSINLGSPTPTPTITPGTVTLFSLAAGTNPIGIVTGPDGNLWFTSGTFSDPSGGFNVPGQDAIGQITTSGSVTGFFPLTPGRQPFAITSRPSDSSLWFTERANNHIGRSGTDGSIAEFNIPTAGALPTGITLGPDDNLWFTESGSAGNNIGQAVVPAVGPPVINEFLVPTTAAELSDIVTGSDGALWFTEHDAARIGRITTAGNITNEFPSGPSPLAITLGPDGNVWYTRDVPGAGAVEFMTPGGATTSFSLPSPVLSPIDITLGPDGNLWVTVADLSVPGSPAGSVVRVTPAGSMTVFPVAAAIPVGITTGPDGNLWISLVSLTGTGQIARVTP